jgi:hypothetical protein
MLDTHAPKLEYARAKADRPIFARSVVHEAFALLEASLPTALAAAASATTTAVMNTIRFMPHLFLKWLLPT